jgi:hypothetical protein
VTGAANNGSGLIRITATAHGFATGTRVVLSGILGTTEAIGAWTVTSIDADHFDLQGSTFTNAWSAGGTQVATSAGIIYGFLGSVIPKVARGLASPVANWDDVSCFLGYNAAATAIAGTDAFYLGHNEAVFPLATATVGEWGTSYTTDAVVTYGHFVANGRVLPSAAVLQFWRCIVDATAYGILQGTGHIYGSRNAANSAFISLFKSNASDQLELMSDTTFSTGVGLTLPETQGADLKATGLKATKTAGEAVAFGDVVYFKSDGKAWKADANVAGTYPAVAMALGTIGANATGSFLLQGVVRNDAWAWTIGGLVYLSTVAGGLTQTQPAATDDAIQVLGVAHPNADTLWFNPQLTYITHT